MISSLNNTLRIVLDNLVPEKKVLKSLKPTCLWYNSELRSHKRKVQKLEKKWLRYKLDSLWIAHKNARNSYYARLNVGIRLQNTVVTANSCTNWSQILQLRQ